MRRILLLSVFLGLFNGSLCITSDHIQPEIHRINEVASPQEYSIAWDIHGVLVQFDWRRALQQANPRAFVSFFGGFSYNFARKIVGKTYDTRYEQALRDLLTLAKAEVSWQGFSETFKKHGFDEIAQSLKQIGLSYDIMPGIIPIINQLHEYGYHQYVASNIGSEFYHLLRARYSELFQHLHGGLTVDMNDIVHKINNNTNVPRKPNPAFFKLFLKKNNIPETAKVLFIDDRTYYIKGAKRVPGFVPIHFKTIENLKQALTDKLGVSFTQ